MKNTLNRLIFMMTIYAFVLAFIIPTHTSAQPFLLDQDQSESKMKVLESEEFDGKGQDFFNIKVLRI